MFKSVLDKYVGVNLNGPNPGSWRKSFKEIGPADSGAYRCYPFSKAFPQLVLLRISYPQLCRILITYSRHYFVIYFRFILFCIEKEIKSCLKSTPFKFQFYTSSTSIYHLVLRIKTAKVNQGRMDFYFYPISSSQGNKIPLFNKVSELK